MLEFVNECLGSDGRLKAAYLKFSCTLVAFAVSVSFMNDLSAKPSTVKLAVVEHLNQSYGRELVSFPFTAKKRSCVPGSIQLRSTNGPVPVQLSDVEFWSDKNVYVKSANILFVVEGLKPLSATEYTLTYDTKDVAAVFGDLKVVETEDTVELGTNGIGIRLLKGSANLDPPKSAQEVPGPVTALRLGKSAWSGGSQLHGDVKIVGWQATVIEKGPVVGRVHVRYSLSGGDEVTLTASLAEGDNTVRWKLNSTGDHTEAGLTLRLPPVPGVKQAILPKGYGQWARSDRKLVLTPGDEHFALLAPNSSIVAAFPDSPPNIVLRSEDGNNELHLYSREPGTWVDGLKPLTYGGHEKWHLETIPKMWDGWQRKRIPVAYAADGTVSMKPDFAKGTRKWWTSAGKPTVGQSLDKAMDMVLEWPEKSKTRNPRLFVDNDGLAAAWKRAETDAGYMKALTSGRYGAAQALPFLMKPEAQRTAKESAAVVDKLRSQLGKFGNYDVMRGAIGVATLYDIIINTDLVSVDDRKLFRAQMAYLGYLMNDPQCWSMEHGFVSGNPNMSVSYTLSLGVIGCALIDHPMSKTWTDYATAWMDKWLDDEVGPNGEWIPEGSHYGYVSLEPMITYAIAMQRAGIHDFSKDERFKKLLLYFAKFNTPRDPQYKSQRAIGAYGRGHSGDRLPVFGIAAPLFKKSDPEFSRVLQWMWAENGYPYYMSDGRLGGCEPYYADSRLPMEAARWGTELFPNLGVLFRSGFRTENESYLNLMAATDSLRNLDVWTPGIGEISQWFGRGAPLSTCFTWQIGYHERHELLRDGVRLARNWGAPEDSKTPFGYYTKTNFEDFSALPEADYARSTFTHTHADDRDWFPKNVPAFPKVKPASGTELTWTRQLLFVKDESSAGSAYIVMRDTTSGGQPTTWQFRTLSEKLGSAQEAAGVDAFLKDKPGDKVAPARPLPDGDRYTALGQFGVDVEYFVASPSDTPRHAIRYGGKWRVTDFQDLFHLQLPGDGDYCVVAYPRRRGEPSPSFVKLADGAILKVTGALGADYSFLAHRSRGASAEGVTFNGTAGSVQIREDSTILTLSAAGTVKYKDHAIKAASACSLKCSPDKLILELPDETGGEFALAAPGAEDFKLQTQNAKTKQEDGQLQVTVKAGVKHVILERKK